MATARARYREAANYRAAPRVGSGGGRAKVRARARACSIRVMPDCVTSGIS